MKTLLKTLLLTACAALSAQAQAQRNVAYQDGKARISLVTDGVVRLEYSDKGQFVDDSSFVAVNRNYAPVKFNVRKRGKQVTITTAQMVISYRPGTGKYSDKDRKSTRLNSSHANISYAVFCLKKKHIIIVTDVS